MSGSKVRHWCFTLNNPQHRAEEMVVIFSGWNAKYVVWQLESGEHGVQHLQGYVEFRVRKRLVTVRSLELGIRMHWEQRQGTRSEAREYCMKEDTRISGPWELGEWIEPLQGKRSDLILVSELIKEGATLKRVADEHPTAIIRYSKGIRELRQMLLSPRTTPPVVVLLLGPPGCGKTRMVVDEVEPEDLWSNCIGAGTWFDGYDGQSDVLLDDFGGKMSHWRLDDFLRIIDRYVFKGIDRECTDVESGTLSEFLSKEDSYGLDLFEYGLPVTYIRDPGGIGLRGILSTPPWFDGLERWCDGREWERRPLACMETLTDIALAGTRQSGQMSGAVFGEDL